MKILILDDVREYVNSLKRALRREFEITEALSLKEAKEKMDSTVQIALVDVRLSEEDPANRDGILFLEWAKANFPEVKIIIMSAYRDHDAAVDALNLGAEYYLKKPINLKELKQIMHDLTRESS